MEQYVIDLFNNSIAAKMSAGEHLVLPIIESGTLIVERLLDDQVLYTCGNGLSISLANTLAHCLLYQYRMERPGLPAFCLSCNVMNATGITSQSSFSDIYSKQLRSLGRQGDLLICFSAGGNDSNLLQAVKTAHDRDMTVIAFTASGDKDISALLTGEDVELRVEHDDRYRIQEIQLLSLFCVCDLIEQQLFGG